MARLGIVASVLWAISAGVVAREADLRRAEGAMNFAYRVCSENAEPESQDRQSISSIPLLRSALTPRQRVALSKRPGSKPLTKHESLERKQAAMRERQRAKRQRIPLQK